MDRLYRIGGSGLVLVLLVQVYAAGWGLFGAGSIRLHVMLGWLLGVYSLIFLLVVALAKAPRREATRWVAAVALIIAQPVLLLALRRSFPAGAALHSLNAVVAILLAVSAWQEARLRRTARANVPGPPGSRGPEPMPPGAPAHRTA